ncbi:MAG: DoxX family membrane protein [Paracoccaceae bacterium]|nr:MAG: DoxX family membrane protein [Paracoccaceae bacterium]
MNRLLSLHDRIADHADKAAPGLLPLIARAAFAAVLLMYFWASAVTKVGPGIAGLFVPSQGAYIQIFPRAVEAAGYDISQLGAFHWLVVLAGTWAEFILPLLVVIGLATRLAALGMIGFVLVQSATDVIGHGVGGETLGAWFDRASDALILDQRTLWIVVLAIPLAMGGGWLSADGWLRAKRTAS